MSLSLSVTLRVVDRFTPALARTVVALHAMQLRHNTRRWMVAHSVRPR